MVYTTKWILLSVIAFLTNNAIGDIMVQPGYGQPHPMTQKTQAITQPPAPLQNLYEHAYAPHSDIVHPGYHIELHPVYGIPNDDLIHPLMQHVPLPTYLSKAAIRRLNSGKLGGLGLVGLPPTTPGHYLPSPVHSRYRRSSSNEQREKRDENVMATKPSVNHRVPLVVDLLNPNGEATKNLDEKHVEVRHSKSNKVTGTLLGLNPSNMRPGYRHSSVSTPTQHPASNSHQQITEQTHTQVNSLATNEEQTPSQTQVARTVQSTFPKMNPENMMHAMLLQHPSPEQYQQHGDSRNSVQYELRNFPDPRPYPVALETVKKETHRDHDGLQTFTAPKHAEASNDKEIVGMKLGNVHTFKTLKHVHQHGTFEVPSYASSEIQPCSCTKPGYVVQNVPTSNVEFLNNPAQLVTQVYQVPSVQATSYPASTEYIMLSPSNNNIVNYAWTYPASSSFTVNTVNCLT